MARLAPEFPFPPYSYVSGRHPHPVSDPQGHQFCGVTPNESQLDPARWIECDAYCYGWDLFQAGYYWEAHEIWESCWHRAGRRGVLADFLKALIKLAAALVKAREQRAAGVRRHASRVRQLIQSTQQATGVVDYAGVDLNALDRAAEQLVEQAETVTQRAANHDDSDHVQTLLDTAFVTG